MKKTIIGILVGTMLLAFTGCSTPKEESPINGKTMINIGQIVTTTNEDNNIIQANQEDENAFTPVMVGETTYYLLGDFAIKYSFFNNVNELLLQLDADKIDLIGTTKSTAEYMMKQNSSLDGTPGTWKAYHSMGISSDNKELKEDFDKAIKELEDNGKLKALQEKHLNATTPEEITLPQFDGAKTVKVGITGAVPPLDYVDETGKPAGFNVATLAEIANILKINIEPVAITSESRLISLKTGKVDVVFWNTGLERVLEDDDSVIFSDAYYTEPVFWITKSDRDFSEFFKEKLSNYTGE